MPDNTPAATAARELAEEQCWRAGAWGLLARLLAAAPDAQLLDELRALQIDTGTQQGPFVTAWEALARSAREAQASRLEADYQRIFIGLTEGEVQPYGSWYLTGFMMERPLVELRQALAGLGITRQQDNREPEDHAAALCESMRLLILDTEVDSEQSLQRQSAFYGRFIQTWLPRMLADLAVIEGSAFYTAVAGFGQALLGVEAAYLGPF